MSGKQSIVMGGKQNVSLWAENKTVPFMGGKEKVSLWVKNKIFLYGRKTKHSL